MTRDDAEKLLGGYATGTLTAQERKLLFEAALADQALFNALADEQALKELLDNPHARRQLLTTLRVQASRPSVLDRLREWLRPPAVRVVAGGVAVAVLAVITVTRLLDTVPPPPEVTEESYRAESEPGRARLKDKLVTRKNDIAPKKAERQEPMVALEKTVREADVKQNKDAERRAAAAPQPDTKLSERPSTASVPEAKTAPAEQPLAKTPAAPPPDLLARSDAAKSVKPGARALFYGTTQQEQTPSTPGAAHDSAAPARKRQFAESRSSTGTASQEQAASMPIQPLGLRYGMVPREEGPALVIEVNQRGYLYASARDAAGATTLVYPAFSADPQAALVDPGLRYFIPPLGALPAARLIVVLSRTPLAVPTVLAAPRPSEKKDALLRQETTEPPLEGVGGPTLYVVEAAPSSSSTLSVEIIVPAR